MELIKSGIPECELRCSVAGGGGGCEMVVEDGCRW